MRNAYWHKVILEQFPPLIRPLSSRKVGCKQLFVVFLNFNKLITFRVNTKIVIFRICDHKFSCKMILFCIVINICLLRKYYVLQLYEHWWKINLICLSHSYLPPHTQLWTKKWTYNFNSQEADCYCLYMECTTTTGSD